MPTTSTRSSLCETRRLDAGLAEAERAIALDPLNVWPSWTREYCLCLARRYDETIAQHKKSEELDPNYYYLDSWAGIAYREKKMNAESVAEYQKVQKTAGVPLAGLGGHVCPDGDSLVPREPSRSSWTWPGQRYVAPELTRNDLRQPRRERHQAFVWLQKSYEARSAYMPSLYGSAVFDPIRSDPRFTALLKKMNLEK